MQARALREKELQRRSCSFKKEDGGTVDTEKERRKMWLAVREMYMREGDE